MASHRRHNGPIRHNGRVIYWRWFVVTSRESVAASSDTPTVACRRLQKKNIGREGKFFEVGAARDRPSAEMIASRWAECLYRHFPAASSYYRSTINLFPAVIVLTWSPASTNSHGHSTPAALANQCQHDSSLIPCVGNVNRDWHFFPVRRQTLILCCCIS